MLLLLTVVSTLHAGDWPTYRNDNGLTGASAERLAFPLHPAWSHAAASRPETAWAGPEGRVFYGSSVDHHVRCADLETGREIWRFATGAAVRLAPTVWQDCVLFGSDDGFVYCLDRTSGELKWQRQAGPRDERILGRGLLQSRWPVRTSVLVDDGVAYFGAGLFPHEDIYLYAVDAATGAVLWKRDTISESDAGRDDLSPQGYLLASEDTLFVPSGRSLPAAVDRKTGELLHKSAVSWRAEGIVGGMRALLVDGQLYSHGEHVIIALDEDTGRPGHASFDARQMAVAGEHAYLADGQTLTKIHLEQAAAASRQRKKLEDQLGDLADKLRGDGDLKAIRRQMAALRKEAAALKATGVLWQVPCEAESSLIVAGPHVLAGGNGQVEAFDARDGERVWTQKVTGDVHGLAVADGHLIVSTDTGRIDCFGPDPAQKTAGPSQPAAEDDRGIAKDERTEFYHSAAKEILQRAGTANRNGFCLLVGAESGRLAAELARQTGETKTEAVTKALKERLSRIRREHVTRSLADELDEIALHCAQLPVQDDRKPDEILGYDDRGLPR
jgi:outer membrane protein assembly factor BamB